MSPFLLILSAPSGAGKTTIARGILAKRDDVAFSVSATTRPPRGREQDGRDYHFLTRDEFERRVDRGDFVEWAAYGGHLYGTLREAIDGLMAAGKHPLLDIDVQGARQIRERTSNSVGIFILPPSVEILVERLTQRSTEAPMALKSRLLRAVEEVADAPDYDYIVINDDRARAVDEVDGIIDAETRRVVRRPDLAKLTKQLRDGLVREARRFGPENG